ncbi:MAG: ribosome maturation factor RimM, partial [Pyrinomonadaceae bacterium]
MNGRDKESDEPLVAVARAVRTRGLKGEIVADLLTDFPERFDSLAMLVAVAPDNKRETVELERHWFQKGRIVLKLKGYDDIEAAKTLVGYEFAVPEAERVPLAEGSFYEWELQ